MNIRKYLMVSLLSSTLLWSGQAVGQNIKVIPNVSNEIGPAATKNIEGVERVFCYTVGPKPHNYGGYTIDNFAITGFCGIVEDNIKEIILEHFFTHEENYDFKNKENCTINPKVMFRFVRGVDNTDILVSAPCYSTSIFYAGKVTTFNMKPIAELLDAFADSFITTKNDFTSPALLNQLLPVGIPQNAEQRALLNKGSQPKRSWNDSGSKSNQSSAGKSGWNALKFGK